MPPSSRARESIDKAAKAHADFSGHDAGKELTVPVPSNKAFWKMGRLDGVLYTAIRDGKKESYIHEFKGNAAPVLAASADGDELRILGGHFEVTERGIEDQK